MTTRAFTGWIILITSVVSEGAAQNSVYGIRGIGFPGRQVSVRARAMGGGIAPFEGGSFMNPAAVAAFNAVRVGTASGTTFRQYSVEDVDVTGLRETRFPYGYLAGGIGRSPLTFSIGFADYAERSFDISTTSTAMINNQPVEVTDRVSSDGGIVDIRGAVGFRASPGIHLGGAVHVINGSTKVSARREFSEDSDLQPFRAESDISFSGLGFSGGFIIRSIPNVQFAGSIRRDSRLSTTVGGETPPDIELPLSVNGGVTVQFSSRLRWAASFTRRSWGEADDDFGDATLTRAFDTWEAGGGFEFGQASGFLPIRVGARYATLPFSPTADQPREWSVAAGTALGFAGGRVRIDAAVERLLRDGAGASERAWYVNIGLTIQPGQ